MLEIVKTLKVKYVGMIFIVICLYICLAEGKRASAAQIGDVFNDENGRITYTITSIGKLNTCAVTDWKIEIEGCESSEYKDLIIPETIKYDNTEFVVTEITPKYTVMNANLSKFVIPATITNINIKMFGFGLCGYDLEYDELDLENGIKFVFMCNPSAFEEIIEFAVVNEAISSIIYVPEEYLEAYRELFKGKVFCYIRDNDRESRCYTGIPIVTVEDEEALPEGFVYHKSFYKILDEDAKTVSLIKKPAETDKEKSGIVYEQPGEVFYKGTAYTVTKIEYFAFCDAKWSVFLGIKLPSTIKSIESKSIGWQITSLDLSQTQIKTIPGKLVNEHYDEYDEGSRLKTVILPESCTKITKKAFYNCGRLKSIVFPSGLKSIGKKAFSTKCKKYVIMGDQLPLGIEKQNMKSTKVYVKDILIDCTKERLGQLITTGKCKVFIMKK